mgnify:CR=1 FL=1
MVINYSDANVKRRCNSVFEYAVTTLYLNVSYTVISVIKQYQYLNPSGYFFNSKRLQRDMYVIYNYKRFTTVNIRYEYLILVYII